jgi:hypothetical protein
MSAKLRTRGQVSRDRPANRANLLGCNEFFIGQHVALNESKDRVAEQMRVLAVVEAKLELRLIRRKMLLGELVVGAEHGPGIGR